MRMQDGPFSGCAPQTPQHPRERQGVQAAAKPRPVAAAQPQPVAAAGPQKVFSSKRCFSPNRSVHEHRSRTSVHEPFTNTFTNIRTSFIMPVHEQAAQIVHEHVYEQTVHEHRSRTSEHRSPCPFTNKPLSMFMNTFANKPLTHTGYGHPSIVQVRPRTGMQNKNNAWREV